MTSQISIASCIRVPANNQIVSPSNSAQLLAAKKTIHPNANSPSPTYPATPKKKGPAGTKKPARSVPLSPQHTPLAHPIPSPLWEPADRRSLTYGWIQHLAFLSPPLPEHRSGLACLPATRARLVWWSLIANGYLSGGEGSSLSHTHPHPHPHPHPAAGGERAPPQLTNSPCHPSFPRYPERA